MNEKKMLILGMSKSDPNKNLADFTQLLDQALEGGVQGIDLSDVYGTTNSWESIIHLTQSFLPIYLLKVGRSKRRPWEFDSNVTKTINNLRPILTDLYKMNENLNIIPVAHGPRYHSKNEVNSLFQSIANEFSNGIWGISINTEDAIDNWINCSCSFIIIDILDFESCVEYMQSNDSYSLTKKILIRRPFEGGYILKNIHNYKDRLSEIQSRLSIVFNYEWLSGIIFGITNTHQLDEVLQAWIYLKGRN